MKTMKNLLIITAILLISSLANSQTTKKDTAIVSKARGVPVFVMCEPTAEYQVIAEVTDTDVSSFLNAVNGEGTYRTIKQSCEVIIDNARRKQTKGKIEKFDAIIISDDGHTGTCIKFTTIQ